MKYFLTALLFSLASLFNQTQAQTVTGLNGFTIFLDPGHSQKENQGLFNYSEAEKMLRVGLSLRSHLLSETDIDTVYMSRTNDSQLVSLTQRTDRANILAVDFYYSLHSDAGGASSNRTLFLYGGWRRNGQTVEKTPHGGKAMGDILHTNLPAAMRIPTSANWADRNFYQGGTVANHAKQYPYLHVNRETNMASLLSESGFHTNPTQQQRNLNADWKRLEAQAHFWTILAYLNVTPPNVGIATGYVTNSSNGETLNGVTVSINDTSYVTDTYASLFNQYSNDPDELSNGFYYLDGLTDGPAKLIFSAPGFYPDTVDVTILSDDFTFTDVSLTSDVPPYVVSNSVGNDNEINPGKWLEINFSRAMDRTSVESALHLTPTADYTVSWGSDTNLRITTNKFDFESSYTLKIDSTATDNSSFKHHLDGNADGTAGDSYVLSFDTGPVDIMAPEYTDIRPTNTQFNNLRPIASVAFNEPLDTATINNNSLQIKKGNYTVPGTIKYYTVNNRGILNFFPSERLDKSINYTLLLSGSISDTVGNSIGSDLARSFPTGDQDIKSETAVDNFESGISDWWQPAQSGSTTQNSIIAEETETIAETSTVNVLTGSNQALRLNYSWKTGESSYLIREYRNTKQPKFSADKVLQAYVFGDGNGNKFRFMVRDGNGELEGSTWYNVDWFGWKLVSWDLTEDDVIAWANGNGTLDGSLLYVDSFQLTYTQGQPTKGFIIFDDLRAVEMGLATSSENEMVSSIPENMELDQNYPNPFNPSTNISFALPQRSKVSLKVYDMLGREVATLFSGTKAPGRHAVKFDASSLSSGMYLYRLTTDFGSITKKMTLLK
jgi:N-acetylmuramoyl-L-alanine amidase